MSDLTIAILILGSLSALALIVGMVAGTHLTRRGQLLLQFVAVSLMLGYLALLWNRPVLASWLPTSGLIIVGNWLPVWGSFFLGMYFQSQGVCFARRALIGAVTLVLVAYSGLAPILGDPPDVANQGSLGDAFQYQTTPYTCSAACAVSLLRLHGVEATEAELAQLCLTRQGTHWMGLYRGMMLKTAGTEWTVTVEEIDKNSVYLLGSPGILALDVDTSVFPEYVDHGFNSEVGHSVVYLGRTSPTCLTVFDPSPDYGIEAWNARILACVKGGVALKLVRRDGASSPAGDIAEKITAMLSHHQLTAGI